MAFDIDFLRKLHALVGSDNPGERESAWTKLNDLLRRHGKTWNDLPELLASGSSQTMA
jgi:hypothetical protein